MDAWKSGTMSAGTLPHELTLPFAQLERPGSSRTLDSDSEYDWILKAQWMEGAFMAFETLVTIQ